MSVWIPCAGMLIDENWQPISEEVRMEVRADGENIVVRGGPFVFVAQKSGVAWLGLRPLHETRCALRLDVGSVAIVEKETVTVNAKT